MILLELLPIIITFLFLIVILSYYVLIFLKTKKPKKERSFSSITIIIPSHNEGRYIGECIESVIAARFKGKKEIIVVDDGSRDNTIEIAKNYIGKIKLITKRHTGKSDSINRAISLSKGELIAVVDGDSFIHENSLQEIVKEIERENVAAATGVIKVRNRKKFICMWMHIEQLYSSLMRHIFSKINANIVTPGPLSVYRKKELLKVGKFGTKGYAEDVDVTIRLIKKGYKIRFTENAVSETNMPYDTRGFFLQRTRLARGLINILKRNLSLNTTIIDIYTLPLLLFNYVQAAIMGAFTIYQLISGYMTYFFSKGIYLDFQVLNFFFEWFSVIGFVKWTYRVIIGNTPLTFFTAIGIVSTLLTYPLYIYAIAKYDRKFDFWHLIPLFFMFPYWLLIMIIYIYCLPEYFRKKQFNIWKKNE